jgi:secondary thiamine-phosphate synthase enzyme
MMAVKTEEIAIETKGFNDIIDITGDVQEAVASSGLANGIVTVFIPGATAGVTTIEYEPGLLKDIPALFEQIAPQGARYFHNDTWHDGNGFSHVRSALIKTSFTVPFVNKRLTLGTWQQIVALDFDNKPRSRHVICQIMGE